MRVLLECDIAVGEGVETEDDEDPPGDEMEGRLVLSYGLKFAPRPSIQKNPHGEP